MISEEARALEKAKLKASQILVSNIGAPVSLGSPHSPPVLADPGAARQLTGVGRTLLRHFGPPVSLKTSFRVDQVNGGGSRA
jgi:hypothetical protein